MTASADSASVSDISPSASPTATWLALAAVVLGHVGLLVVFPDGTGLVPVVVLEGGLLAIAAGSELLFGGRDRGTVGVLGFAWLLLVGGAVLATRVWDPLIAAFALVCVVALLSYALHRVELVALGLVEVADERE
ncbi:hypothetical protein [Halosimplex salinum]|uniref:hypothetical protein n=1 Tax=Halosimplex salinum TaxID=1710538 RepID=UPI0013DDB7D6|nr:hypothetical protein [Halosimplex salinum]